MIKTLDQVERMKEKAVRFVRDVLKDDDHADEIEDEDPEDYAERKRITIMNPQERRNPMLQSKTEMKARIRQLEAENQELQDKLDSIANVVNDDDEDDEDEDEDAEDDDEEGE